MSHEIRAPMNAILGLAYLLRNRPIGPAEHDMVQKIRNAGRSLLGIINDILDFSKIEAGRLEIEHAPFRLGDVLDNVATIMGSAVGEKDIELIVGPVPFGAMFLMGDALRLEQVLINLASNAIKFTETGEVALTVSVVDTRSGEADLRFAMRDTGIGIPVEKEEIFSAKKVIFRAFTADRRPHPLIPSKPHDCEQGERTKGIRCAFRLQRAVRQAGAAGCQPSGEHRLAGFRRRRCRHDHTPSVLYARARLQAEARAAGSRACGCLLRKRTSDRYGDE